MKFENNEELHFGYAELEPVTAEAKIKKGGKQQDKTPTITWTIDYTPWQNPSAENSDITMDTLFELVDTIDSAVHSFVKDSVKIDGSPVTVYASRDEIPADAQTYALIEETADGQTALTIGGEKLCAGAATAGKPATSMKITYDTVIEKELLLPGSAGDAGAPKVANAAELFAGKDGTFHKLGISGKDEVSIERPDWLKKEGNTTRHTDGTGSTTEWTITFLPNGFTFTKDNALTFHDKLPEGSTLASGSVKIDGVDISAEVKPEGNNGFAIPSIETAGDPVTITYWTTVPEEMYDSGTSLGENTAWFTFSYQDKEYMTPEAKTPVGSGDGSGKPGTATLVKENGGYHAKTHSIDWTVKINPHKAYLKSGTFVDDLGSTGGTCGMPGHVGGLMLPNGTIDDVTVQIDGQPLTDADKDLVELLYDAQSQILTVEVKEVDGKNVGARTITLQYTTKVCDPCIFANNTDKKEFVNKISTEDMVIGKTSSEPRSASAQSPVEVSANVLTKKAPVYDYKKGIMSWTLEVDAAELPMTGVILTDTLPEGLTYVDGSLHAKSAADSTELNANLTVTDAGPSISAADPKATGQLLEIDLSGNSITGKILITFDTKVDLEKAGFNSDSDVMINNTAFMTGSADGVSFAQVSHSVQQKFANHGLVKSSKTDNQKELIEYEVLINPFGLALPGNPSLVDTLDKRLQLDEDTLKFYEAELSGNSSNAGQKPGYTIKRDTEQSLKVADLDPVANSFTVKLPIKENSRSAYVLTYSADIMEREAGGYGNSVRFEGGSVKLGGEKQNSAPVSGGGGGGGGGVASRKVTITITQTDSITKKPLEGVAYTLYQWDSANNRRGLPVAQGITDAQGKVSFKVKPRAEYVLVQTKGIGGYDQIPGWDELPEGASGGGGGILITAGTAGSGRELELTNKADPSGKPDQPGDSGSTGNGDNSSGGSSGSSESTGNGDSGGTGSSGSSDGSGYSDSTDTSGMSGETESTGIFGETEMTGIFGEDPGNMLQADGETGLRDQSGALSGRGVHSPQTGDDTSWRQPNIFLAAIAVFLAAGIFYAVRKRKTEWTEADRDP